MISTKAIPDFRVYES